MFPTFSIHPDLGILLLCHVPRISRSQTAALLLKGMKPAMTGNWGRIELFVVAAGNEAGIDKTGLFLYFQSVE